MTMVAAIVELKKHGLHSSIEIFSTAECIQDIVDHVADIHATITEIMTTEKYVVKPIHNVEGSVFIIDIFAESFVMKEPLCVLLGLTKPDFLDFAHSLYRAAEDNPFSIAVIDQQTGKIVGADFLFEFSTPPDVQPNGRLARLFSLFEEIEEAAVKHLRKSCRLMMNFALCVDTYLPPADQVQVCHLMESAVLSVARNHGFGGVITINTHPVTQVSAQNTIIQLIWKVSLSFQNMYSVLC